MHDWLAWSETPSDRNDPTLRAAWVRKGISRLHVEQLARAGYTANHVQALADGVGTSSTAAARLLVAWVDGRVLPQPVDLVRLHDIGAPSYDKVNRAAVDRLSSELSSRGISARREEAAALLATSGSCGFALAITADGTLPDPGTAMLRLAQYDDQRAGRRRSPQTTGARGA